MSNHIIVNSTAHTHMIDSHSQNTWQSVTSNDKQLTGIEWNTLQSTRKYIPSLLRWTLMCFTGLTGP